MSLPDCDDYERRSFGRRIDKMKREWAKKRFPYDCDHVDGFFRTPEWKVERDWYLAFNGYECDRCGGSTDLKLLRIMDLDLYFYVYEIVCKFCDFKLHNNPDIRITGHPHEKKVCIICDRTLIGTTPFMEFVKNTKMEAKVGRHIVHHIWYGEPQRTIDVCDECHGHIHGSRKGDKWPALRKFLNRDTQENPMSPGVGCRPAGSMGNEHGKLTLDEFM